MKSSQAWRKKAPDSCKGEQWNLLKQQWDNPHHPSSEAIETALQEAAKELSFAYAAIRSWIEVYVDRCDNGAHHGNLETKIKAGDIDGGRRQIWADKEELREMTPDNCQQHCLHVMKAIKDYQDDVFVSCPRKGKIGN